jgi:adenylate cyclase, class 2
MFRLAYPRFVMAVEIEAKMRVEDVEAVVALLKEHNATALGDYLERNIFYDTEDRNLLAADEGLRIRSARDLNSGNVRTVLTHKGPNGYGQLKNREETEVGIEDADAAGQLVERLGYRRWLTFEKRRRSWQLDGCRIDLDHLPHLGHFIEIEGPTEEWVMKMRDRLGMGSRPLIKASYVAMLTSYMQERGQRIDDIRFPEPARPAVAKAG